MHHPSNKPEFKENNLHKIHYPGTSMTANHLIESTHYNLEKKSSNNSILIYNKITRNNNHIHPISKRIYLFLLTIFLLIFFFISK